MSLNCKIEPKYEMPRDRIIHSPTYSLVLLHNPGMSSRFVGEVTFHMQGKRYEFEDKQGVGIDLR